MLAKFLVSCLALSASVLAIPTQEKIKSLGYLRVSVGKDVIGYVSKEQNDYGEFIGVSPSKDSNDVAHRLLVEFDVASTGATNLVTKNGPSKNFPYLGVIAGEGGSNLGLNSSYLLLGGTGESQPGAPASYIGNSFTDATNTRRKAASAVWAVNATSGAVSVVQVNANGSSLNSTYVGYVNGGFIVVGSKSKFSQDYEDDVEWVKFTFTTD